MQILVIQNNFIKAVFLDYGAILHELWVTSESGQTINVIQGLANLEDYREDEWCRGALIGRFAGRLTESYSIDGTVFPLYHTDGVLLHSGDSGWGKQFWKLEHHTQKELTFSHICQARNSGFPGTVKGQITYKLKGKERAPVAIIMCLASYSLVSSLRVTLTFFPAKIFPKPVRTSILFFFIKN